MTDYKLFSAYKLGNLKLKNRVVMAPMTRSRALNDNAPSELNATYYGQRSGAGLIITEGTSPSPNGLGYPRIPGIFSKKQIEGWKLVTDAVHKNDSKIFLQVMHTGRVGHVDNLPAGAEVVAPTDKVVSGEMYTDIRGPQPYTQPRKMTIGDIEKVIQEHIDASINAIKAGFDGIEIHGANGYLVEQFINPNVNDRTDQYGGNIENRVRFLEEVVRGTATAIGKDKVGLRLSPYGVFNDTGAFDGLEDTYQYIAHKMNGMGIAYLHVLDHSPMGAPEVPDKIKNSIRTIFKGTIILCGGYDREIAEADLQTGAGDLIAFGRPFLANPDLVSRMKKNAPLNDPDQNTFYTPGEEGYIDYPTLEDERITS